MALMDVLPVLEEPWALEEAQATLAHGLAQAGYTRAAIAAILNCSTATVGRRLAQAQPSPHVPPPLGFLGPTPPDDAHMVHLPGEAWCPDCLDDPAHRVYCLTCNSYGGYDAILAGERIAVEAKERAKAEREAAERRAELMERRRRKAAKRARDRESA